MTLLIHFFESLSVFFVSHNLCSFCTPCPECFFLYYWCIGFSPSFMFQNKCHLLTGTSWTTLIIPFGYPLSQPFAYEHILLYEVILFSRSFFAHLFTSHPLVRYDTWHRASCAAPLRFLPNPCSLHFLSKAVLTLTPRSEPFVIDSYSKLLTNI